MKPGDSWHGFEGLAENHVMVDPIKVTILTPGLLADGRMEENGIPAAVVVRFLSSRRIEIEKTGLYSFLVLFSQGITKGKWSTLITELLNFKDLYDRNAPLNLVMPGVVEQNPTTYDGMGLKDLCTKIHEVYRRDDVPKAQREMYTVLPEMALRPAEAYDALVRSRVESVEIDRLMGRTLAVMIVPYPPGIPLIMPGERITQESRSIQDYLIYARDFDRLFPGFETDIHGLRFDHDGGTKTLSRGLRRRRTEMIPRDVKSPTVAVRRIPRQGCRGRRRHRREACVIPGERWDERAKPMRDYFLTFEESFNRFPGFNYEVQGVFQERIDGRIKFHTYVVRE